MRLRLLCILISVLFNLTVYSFCFAQTDAANTIIEDRIDELWTTGKLHVGNANIASKHWLPGLYERNDFKLLWQNPQNVTDLLTDVGRIAEDGLDPEDYHLLKSVLKKYRDIQKVLDTNETLRVNLPQPKPVMLIYATIRFDDEDNFMFKKDIYGRDRQVLEGLNEEFTIWQTRAIK